MRVVVVTQYYRDHPGGLQIVAGELASGLAQLGLEMIWVASEPAPLVGVSRVTCVPMSCNNYFEARFGVPIPLWGLESLRRLYQEIRLADIVHLHDCLYMGNILSFTCAKVLGKRIVISQHIDRVKYASCLLDSAFVLGNRLLTGPMLQLADGVVLSSRKVLEYFFGLLGRGFSYEWIANGIDYGLFSPASVEERDRSRRMYGIDRDAFVVAFVGRFVEKKGLELLRIVAESTPDWQWVFVGYGPLDPRQWKLRNIRYVGTVGHEDIRVFYSMADTVVLPSWGEGMPLVVQEACACGLPIVISAETAQAWPGLEKLAYVSELTPSGVLKELRSIAENRPRSASGMESAVFARQNWTDWETCCTRYYQLYKRVLGCRVPKA